jgi:hypothetical protein
MILCWINLLPFYSFLVLLFVLLLFPLRVFLLVLLPVSPRISFHSFLMKKEKHCLFHEQARFYQHPVTFGTICRSFLRGVANNSVSVPLNFCLSFPPSVLCFEI